MPSWVISWSETFLVGVSWDKFIIVGLPFFSSGNFVVQKLFLVGFLWVQNVFLWVFRGSKIFACGLLVDPFFSVANFANRKFSAIGCMIKSAHFNNCQPCLY